MENIADIYPLTPMQEGMLYHCLRESDSDVYIEQISCVIDGELDVEAFQRAWQMVVDRHDALRTAFLWDGLDEPLQVVRQRAELSFFVQDWREMPEAQQQAELEAFLQADLQSPFDLAGAPLMRLNLIRLKEDRYHFTRTMHHIMTDGWSLALLFTEAIENYSGICSGNPPNRPAPPPFRNFLTWLQEQDDAAAGNYWRRLLANLEAPLSLRELQTSTSQCGFALPEWHFSPEKTAKIEAFCRSQRITLSTLFNAAWAILLSRYISRSDVVFGNVVSGRPTELSGSEEMMGLFLNTIPVRLPLFPDEPVGKFLQRVQNQLIESLAYQQTPLNKIQTWCGLPGGGQLFDSLIVFENYPRTYDGNNLPGGLNLHSFRHYEHTNFPLAIVVEPDSQLRIIAIYDRSRFQAAFIDQLYRHLEQILDNLTKDAATTLENIDLFSPEERQKLLFEWNQTQKAFPEEQLLHHLFEEQAEKSPHDIAVIGPDETLTYGELNRRANQLAHHLINLGVAADMPVGVCLDRSTAMITAMLAVLKSGAAYVPLDPAYPPKRLEMMISDARLTLLITRDESHSPKNSGLRVVHPDAAAGESEANPQRETTPENLAYIMYTSGSTGQPRGVMVTHRNVVHSTTARAHYYTKRVGGFLLLSSFSFDSSVAGIYWTLSQGGALCIPDTASLLDSAYLAGLIQKHKLTHMLCIPSLYRQLLETEAGQTQTLTTVIVAGEACPPGLVWQHRDTLPETELYNEYGPTEATVWATVFNCMEGISDGRVPIGKPIANVQVYVLDTAMRPVPIWAAGEIYIGGAGLAKGYLHQPELTAEKFIPSPFEPSGSARLYKTGDRGRWLPDGKLEFLGRIDTQVKIRGHRVELGSIEAALAGYPAVKEAAVVTRSLKRPQSATGIDEQSPQVLAEELMGLPMETRRRLLAELDNLPKGTLAAPPETGKTGEMVRVEHGEQYEINLRLRDDQFINPPRRSQRNWLIGQALTEFKANLEHLDQIAPTFVPGSKARSGHLEEGGEKMSADAIMEDWQRPIMAAMARKVTESHGDVLEIGFGRGVSAEMIQHEGVRSHTIIEFSEAVIDQFFKPWAARYPEREIRLVKGRWQEAVEHLTDFDGVFFHAVPLDEEEFSRHMVNSITFAEHFFPTAANLLREGGVFTYLSTEIDSLSRRHQRALFKYFSEISLSVLPLSVPPDTRDLWWAQSMVIVKAVK